MTSPDGTWHLGIGDPTPIGWLTVIAYFLAAWGCWTVFVAAGSSPGTRSTARFWLLLAVALGALGINKQLDLQTALTEIGRALAHSGGWYERRHEVQIYFIVAVGVSGALARARLPGLTADPPSEEALDLQTAGIHIGAAQGFRVGPVQQLLCLRVNHPHDPLKKSGPVR